MPAQESKPGSSTASGDAAASVIAESTNNPAPTTAPTAEDDSGASSGDDAPSAIDGSTASATSKKSKKRKLKGKSKEPAAPADSEIGNKLSKDQIAALLDSNPALKNDLSAQAEGGNLSIEELLKRLKVSDVLTGTAPGGKNKKDMASHAFWKTQPVPGFDEARAEEDGVIKEIDVERVPKEPSAMHPGFEWVTMDLEDEKQVCGRCVGG
jgi:glycylpeptide N-tetradecanoyltransferase